MTPRLLARRARQRGVALLLVLWACTLLAILLGGYAAMARTEGLQARFQFAQTQAHYDAEAGLVQAIYRLQDPRLGQRWIGDGRAYTLKVDQATVVVRAIDESGKVDLNSNTPETLQGLFRAAGVSPDQARRLADRFVEWRSIPTLPNEADQQRAAYAAAGRDYGPRHRPFATIEEAQMVLGMTPALYRRIAPVLTIWGGNTSPNPNTAPALALQAMPGITPGQLATIRATRATNANDPTLALNNGTTHSIESEATLADGTRAVLRATIRMQPVAASAKPYVVLRWQEGRQE